MHSYDLNHEKANAVPVCGCVLEPLWQPCRALWWNWEPCPWQPNSTSRKNDAPTQKWGENKKPGFSLFPLKAAIFLIQSCIFQTHSLHLSRCSPGACIREEFFLWLQWGRDSVHKVLKVVKTCNWCGTIQSATRSPETKSIMKKY